MVSQELKSSFLASLPTYNVGTLKTGLLADKVDGGALFFIFHMRTQDLLCQVLLWTIFHVVHRIICHQEPRLKSSAPENERKENCVWSQHTRPGDQFDAEWVLELLVWAVKIILT